MAAVARDRIFPALEAWLAQQRQQRPVAPRFPIGTERTYHARVQDIHLRLVELRRALGAGVDVVGVVDRALAAMDDLAKLVAEKV
jgi:hypothetical protein